MPSIGRTGKREQREKRWRAVREALPKPSASSAVVPDDPSESAFEFRNQKLRRARDLISGK